MAIRNLDNKTLARLKIAVFLLALIPLARLGSGAYLNMLGANPIEKITRITGYWALTFLLISLTLTPLRRMLGWLWLIRLRRLLSLFCIF
jgi:sulfoxide reductase heme-binding subunit YedZ